MNETSFLIKDLARNDGCHECGSITTVWTATGLTCAACGLVLREERRLVRQLKYDESGHVTSDTAPRTRGGTKIGSIHEQVSGKHRDLVRTQKRASNDYRDRKFKRGYFTIARIVSGMQIPSIVQDEAAYLLEKVMDLVRPGTGIANIEVLAAVTTFFAAKVHRVRAHLTEIAKYVTISMVEFKRGVLRLGSMLRHLGLMPDKDSTTSSTIQDVSRIMREHSVPVGFDEVTKVYERLAPAYSGMKMQTRVGVTCYVLAHGGYQRRSIDMPQGLLCDFAKQVSYSPSSLYNAVTRVLGKLGFKICPLREMDLTPFFEVETAEELQVIQNII